MDYQKLFLTFDGRLNRQPFWLGSIAIGMANAICEFIFKMIFGDGVIASIVTLIAVLILAYAAYCLIIKRYHDRGKSGWWSLILLIPVIGLIWYVVETGFLRGTAGYNRFGPDPLAKMA